MLSCRRLKDQLFQRDRCERLGVGRGCENLRTHTVLRRNDESHPRMTTVVIGDRESLPADDLSSFWEELSIPHNVSVGGVRVNSDPRDDELVSRIISLFRLPNGVLEPGLVDRSQLTKLHALIGPFHPST